MKSLFKYLAISLTSIFAACAKDPAPGDIVGAWVANDGAEIVLESSGRFAARALPASRFFSRPPEGEKLNGAGSWKLEKGSPYWTVLLSFRDIQGKPASYGVPLLVSGSGASAYLYRWEGEEGGAKYKLVRRME